MFRFILIVFVFLLSLLTIFPPPAVQLWYVSIAVTEFSWIFGTFAFLLLFWSIKATRYKVPTIALSLLAFMLCCSTVIRAYIIANDIDKRIENSFGVTPKDLTGFHQDNSLIYDSKKVLQDFLGGSPDEVRQKYIDASPMDHVNAQTVPTLLVQGKNDAHVWLIQSERLQKKLDEYKVKNLLLALPWATHGCEYSLKSPSGQLAMYATERFLFAVTQKRN